MLVFFDMALDVNDKVCCWWQGWHPVQCLEQHRSMHGPCSYSSSRMHDSSTLTGTVHLVRYHTIDPSIDIPIVADQLVCQPMWWVGVPSQSSAIVLGQHWAHSTGAGLVPHYLSFSIDMASHLLRESHFMQSIPQHLHTIIAIEIMHHLDAGQNGRNKINRWQAAVLEALQ